MLVITVLLYALAIIISLLLAVLLFILLVPIRYNLLGGYKNSPWLNFKVKCTPAFILQGTWLEKLENESKLKITFVLFGWPVTINPQRLKKKKTTKKENKKSRKKGRQRWHIIVDRDLRRDAIKLGQDLLHLLKPERCSFKAIVGFDEPHLTGWLAAVSKAMQNWFKNTSIEIEPCWEEECYEFEALLEGRLLVGLMLIKAGWFFLALQTRRFFRRTTQPELTTASKF